jgi:hypothetical protein
MSRIWIPLSLAVVALVGCSPIVGARCAEGYELCVDHCCLVATGIDAGLDAPTADVLLLDADVMEADAPRDTAGFDVPFDAVPFDAPLADGEVRDAEIPDALDRDAAGDDDAGMLICGPPEVPCGGICTDPMIDPEHCGECGVFCPSGLCVDGLCQGAPVGHIVAIGHDYETSRIAMRRIVGNAVFLTRSSPVRVLAYVGTAATPSRVGTDAAIDATAAELGRAWVRTPVSAAAVPTMLPTSDVLLVYAQAGATDAELTALGTSWSSAVTDFLDDGGVIIVLDTVTASNGGTHQILEAMGRFTATGVTDVSRTTMTVVTGSDAVALGVPSPYRSERTTVRFDGASSGVVVRDESGAAVVVHLTTP